MIYVTHDQVEAMTMADKIVVLERRQHRSGRLAARTLFNNPDNVFVAGFIGSPKMNLLDGEVAAKQNAATIGVRPEHLSLSKEKGEWRGTVTVAEHLGSDTFLHVRADGIGQLTARADGEFGVNHGDTVFMTPDPARIHRFDAGGAGVAMTGLRALELQ